MTLPRFYKVLGMQGLVEVTSYHEILHQANFLFHADWPKRADPFTQGGITLSQFAHNVATGFWTDCHPDQIMDEGL